MVFKWSDLAYWNTGEWQTVKERLADNAKAKRAYVPARNLLFRSLDAVPFGKVRCMVCGQDPYPTAGHGTGVAFSVPATVPGGSLPPTLINIFKEYQADLHYPMPSGGDLSPWCEQGVLLWNVYPSCAQGKPGSHHWDEWTYLTKEIIEKLDSDRKLCFVLLGAEARKCSQYIKNNPLIETSHPSPLGARHGFLGSRIFSRTNGELCKLGIGQINWRLP